MSLDKLYEQLASMLCHFQVLPLSQWCGTPSRRAYGLWSCEKKHQDGSVSGLANKRLQENQPW
jgi:hypothetical protein